MKKPHPYAVSCYFDDKTSAAEIRKRIHERAQPLSDKVAPADTLPHEPSGI